LTGKEAPEYYQLVLYILGVT